MPLECGSGITLAAKTGGETYFSPDNGENFYKIAFRGDVKQPRYINVMGDVFFYAEDSNIYISRDGVEWTMLSASQKIKTLARVGDQFIVNGTEKIDIPKLPHYTNVIIDDTVMQYDRQVKKYSTEIAFPLEATAEKIGAEYSYSEIDGSVTLKYDGKTVKLRTGSNMITVGREKSYLKSSVQYLHNRVFVPSEVMEILGFETEYFENSDTLVIKSTKK